MKMKISILGATSHIAKGLIYNFLNKTDAELYLFGRSPDLIKEFLEANRLKGSCAIMEFKDFPDKKSDIIINCVGLGSPRKLSEQIASFFTLAEYYDNLVLESLSRNPDSRYINFSSGAVYGSSFKEAAGDRSIREILVNKIDPQDYYGIAKINSEAKHRAHKDLNIVDIRVFSYFSRFIDLEAGYFLTDLVKCVKKKEEFTVNSCEFIRDYLHPSDLFKLIQLIIKKNSLNSAFDAYSRGPVGKNEILEFFARAYGLKYKADNKLDFNCPTGEKNSYYSNSRKAAGLGFIPEYSSLDTIKTEVCFILGKPNG